jgi:DNA mismatch endonuclease (patch repair protein)
MEVTIGSVAPTVSSGGAKRRGPIPLSEAVSRQMSSMPSRDTGTEKALRRELHKRGMRYRTHLKTLPGRPDIAFTRARIAVFVDGCFWHRCPDHGTAPKNNGKWWADKLDANVARDRRNDGDLRKLGWISVHVWEHDDPVVAAESIELLWRDRVRETSGCLTRDVGPS